MSQKRDEAIRTLTLLLRRLHKASKIPWTPEDDKSVERIVDNIISDAEYKAKQPNGYKNGGARLIP